MDLSNAKLGDQFRIFLDALGNISKSPSMKTLMATVIATKKPGLGTGLILGWKGNEQRPADALSRNITDADNDYIETQSQYRWGKSVSRDTKVAIQIFNGLDGLPCKKCTNFYPLSEPNQADGTLICWSCRRSY